MNAIAAVYDGWGLGKDGTQPIVVPDDRRRFRALTDGATIVVGRRTLADFPGGRPLKNRRNIVLSRQSGLTVPGSEVARDETALFALLDEGENVFVVGGASVYRLLLPRIRRVYLTRLYVAPACDVFFPDLDAAGWRVTEESPLYEHEGIPYRYMTYER